ncbi:cardiolipin synthase [Bacillus luteolus]|uniref:Cardiolipin synthase n=1 Tax=Litchfieldia luteola TaxID=682179 RepID=A0ABR9QGV3_9BACI|nr:cardiolipin synthase [Cytobacillus luteolus]MBE4907732.1 cardiolipin synthase [Cytobacillus luteolus]MBP1944080.1 cardiolipin synthase [Cytobacillus luteolus]
MNVIATVFAVLMILFLWLRIDYKLGRKKHLSIVNKREFPERKSNLKLFTEGNSLFTDLFNEIENAKEHIHILFYIVKDDKISREFLTRLKKKAQEGVEVRLLVDWVGNKISKEMKVDLKKSGVQLFECHIPRFPYLFYSLNARNHRKVTVIDGKIGYLGGYNVGKEYLGNDSKFGFWRDYHLKIEGKGVQDLQMQFLYDWKDRTTIDLTQNPNYFPPLIEGQSYMKLVPTDGAYLQSHFLELLNTAKKEVKIGSPYFIPGSKLSNAILYALKRGVKVTILLPRKADHLFVKEAAVPYFQPLLKAGAKIYFYEKGFYHAKVFIIDDVICDIGTANFDKRSLYLNHEINCYIYDKTVIQEVKAQFSEDLAFSTEITLESLQNRSIFQKWKESFSTLISAFL